MARVNFVNFRNCHDVLRLRMKNLFYNRSSWLVAPSGMIDWSYVFVPKGLQKTAGKFSHFCSQFRQVKMKIEKY